LCSFSSCPYENPRQHADPVAGNLPLYTSLGCDSGRADVTGIRSSLLISFGDRYAVLLIQFVSTIVIARLLTPTEMGVYSVGAAAVAIAHTLRDFGVSTYLIQEQHLTAERISAALFITLLLAWSLAAIVWLAASPLADFYSETGLMPVLHVVAITFVLIPVGSVSMALLRRELRFSEILAINVASAVVHAVVGICLAALGFGFMSLAWAGLAGVVATVAGAVIATPKRPGTIPSLAAFRRVLGFGGRASTASLASAVGNAAPDLIIGRLLGFTSLGYFNRALGFVQLFERGFTDGLRPVMLPYFSRERRNGQDLRTPYLRATEFTLGLAWPCLALLAFLAPVLVRLLYGPQWDPAASLAQGLCLGVAARAINPLTASILVASGNVHAVMMTHLRYQPLKIILLLVGSWFGLIQAVIAFTVAEIVGFIIFLSAAQGAASAKLQPFILAMIRAAAIACFALLPCWLWLTPMDLRHASIFEMLLYSLQAGALASIATIVALVAFRHPLAGELLRIAKPILKRQH